MSELNPADELLRQAAAERAPEPGRQRGPDDQVIVFRVAGTRSYALPISAVERTEPVSTITPVPRSPTFVRGLASLQGGVICTVELQRLLDQEALPNGASQEHPARSLLILVDEGRRLALFSAGVPDFLRLPADAALPVPSGSEDVYRLAFEREGELVGLLDPGKLFDLVEQRLAGRSG